MSYVTTSRRAALSLRQSVDDEDGIAKQRKLAKRMIKGRGWTLADEDKYIDNDLAATGKVKRPGFEALLKDLENGTIDVVIGIEMSRITRNPGDTWRLYEVAEKRSTLFCFLSGGDIDMSTPAGRFVFQVLAAMAQHENEEKSRRQKAANVHAAEQGQWRGGRRPFGYEADGVTIRPDEKEALRSAYSRIVNGESLAAVCRDWARRGMFTPQLTRTGEPSQFKPQTIRTTLLNPRYAGLRAIGVVRPGHRKAWEIVSKAEWPSVVDEETWRAACAALNDPSRMRSAIGDDGKPRLRARPGQMTGLGLCGICDATVHQGATPMSARGRYKTYRCSGSSGHISRAAEPVDAYVWAVVVARLSEPDAVELFLTRNDVDTTGLREKAAVIRRRRDDLAAAYSDPDSALTITQLNTANASFSAQLEAIYAKLAEAGAGSALTPLIGADDVAARLADFDVDQRRSLINSLMVVRLYSPGRGTRVFRPDGSFAFRPETVGIEWR